MIFTKKYQPEMGRYHWILVYDLGVISETHLAPLLKQSVSSLQVTYIST